MTTVNIVSGDCLARLRQMPAESVHAVITDPPYGLSATDPAHVVEVMGRWAAGDRDYVPTGRGFMGQAWDAFVPPPAVWDECRRVLTPEGHLLVFAGSRTFDLMTLSVRFAGFDIRDSVAWLYGSGFPKSLDVSKAVDKLDATAERRARALEFTTWMRSTGITRQQAAAASGMASITNHYFEVTAQPLIATADIFDLLRPYLPAVPERIEALVRQRTVESANHAARAVTGVSPHSADRSAAGWLGAMTKPEGVREVTAAHTPEAEQWSGWGTALKPAFEPIVVARKPLSGTVAGTVLEHGTGALNIDATRVGLEGMQTHWADYAPSAKVGYGGSEGERQGGAYNPSGRWPTNVVLDGATADALDEQSGKLTSGANPRRRGADRTRDAYDAFAGQAECAAPRGVDSGGASRFFPVFRYQAKAPTRERPFYLREDGSRVAHPTVKPLELMRWLVRLVTPPGGVVLDPFAGSGTTVEAAVLEGVRGVVAVEREPDYHPLIEQRLARARAVRTESEGQA